MPHLFLSSFVLTSWKNLTQCFHWLWHAEMILFRKLEQTLWRPVVKWQQLSWQDCKRDTRSFLPKHLWETCTPCFPRQCMSSSILHNMIIWWKKILRSECHLSWWPCLIRVMLGYQRSEILMIIFEKEKVIINTENYVHLSSLGNVKRWSMGYIKPDT